MTTVNASLETLARDLLARNANGRGAVIAFMSAVAGEGVSQLVRNVGEIAAAQARRAVALIDLDLAWDGQFRSIVAQRSEKALGPGASGALGGTTFFEPRALAEAFTFHRVGRLPLLVSHFDVTHLEEGDQPRIVDSPDYWAAARRSCELVLVDAPARARSRDGLAVASAMDGVVIVASGVGGSASATLALKAELEARGANVLGLVYAETDTTSHIIERALSRL